MFENLAVKKEVFGQLDRVCRQGAILATNTSALDINEIAVSTSRPRDVTGMHFFSPANVMSLLEDVRGEASSDGVIATVMSLCKRIGKVGVLVGVREGFVGKPTCASARHRRSNGSTKTRPQRRSMRCSTIPAFPWARSRWLIWPAVCWIMPKASVRPTAVGDHGRRDRDRPAPGRYYTTRDSRGRDPRALSVCDGQHVCDGQRGRGNLGKGVAARALDIDTVGIRGYGFPAYRGGLMYWADQVGLESIAERLRQFHADAGQSDFGPPLLLERQAGQGQWFTDV